MMAFGLWQPVAAHPFGPVLIGLQGLTANAPSAILAPFLE